MTAAVAVTAVVLLAAALAACAATGTPPPGAPGREPLPDFRPLWDFGDPAASERRFLDLLPRYRESGDDGRIVELLSQIARARGLGRRFEDAHATLDEAEAMWAGRGGVPRVRLLLERGRAFNSAGAPERARPLFIEAIDVAETAGHGGLHVDALHMVAIASAPEEALAWNDRAIAVATSSEDAGARAWLGSLCNNQGWTRFERGEYDLALDLFRRGLEVRRAAGQEREVLIARWSVAKTRRMQGHPEEALAEQRLLLAAWEARGEEDGFVPEEIAECLHALGRTDESRPWFRRAHGVLSKDPWISRDEPERVRRLALLAGDPGPENPPSDH